MEGLCEAAENGYFCSSLVYCSKVLSTPHTGSQFCGACDNLNNWDSLAVYTKNVSLYQFHDVCKGFMRVQLTSLLCSCFHRYTPQTTIITITLSDDVTTAYSGLLTSFKTLNFIEALLANGYKWCFSDGFMLKVYLSSSSGTPKCLTYIVTIVMFDKSKLTSMKKTQKVMVAEVVYLLGAYARNPAR